MLSATEYGSVIIGSPFNDTISAGAGVDTLTGGGGSDTFSDNRVPYPRGVVPHDTNLPANLNGDTITDFNSRDILDLSLQPTSVTYSSGALVISGIQDVSYPYYDTQVTIFTPNFSGPSVSVGNYIFILDNGATSFSYTGSSTDFNIMGTDKPDAISAGNNAQSIYGLSGDDTLTSGASTGGLYGNAGNDHITLGVSISSPFVYGGQGDDLIDAGQNTSFAYLSGDLGNDTITAGAGTDQVFGGSGNDVIVGGSGTSQLYGNQGNDTINLGAGSGASTVYAGQSGSPQALALLAAG